MRNIDISFFYFLNGFAGTHKGFDHLMIFLVNNNFLKGGILVMILWWSWFRDRTKDFLTRRKVFLTLVSCIVTLVIVRFVIMILPFKSRPMHDYIITFILPDGLDPSALDNWSSFPSDHAALFFALATGIWFISKKLGFISLLYVALVICLPRLYLGYHYISDIISGTIIGCAVSWILIRGPFNDRVSSFGLNWSVSAPASFYTVFFLLTYQIAVLFDPLRQMGSYVMDTLSSLL